jgi:hypothetical protein
VSADGAALTGPQSGLKPWAPGQSGNPGGLSKVKREVKDLAKKNSVRAMQKIVDLIDDDDSRVALAAAIEVKNTAIGKPRVRDLTKEEIEAEVDKRIRQLAEQANALRRQGALDVTPK